MILDGIKTPELSDIKSNKKSPRKGIILLLATILILIIFAALFYKAGFTFSKIIVIKEIAWEKIFGKLPSSEYTEYIPPKDEDRINVLLLGIGGREHEEGSLLTDSIMIISFKKSTGKVALIFIPRDLYVGMPGENYYEKVNAAYVIGEQKYGNGLDYTKKTIGYITGVYIDYAAAIDFEAFTEVINILGGVNIYLNQRFVEDKQWWCDQDGNNCRPFIVEPGEQTLDGETALFYVRSRFSSSDFDRGRRQQQIMLAIKDKVLSLGILANPLMINNLFDAAAKHIRADVKPWEIPSLIKLAQEADTKDIVRKVFDVSSEGLLQQVMRDGIYILLPADGNFDKIREASQRIFE